MCVGVCKKYVYSLNTDCLEILTQGLTHPNHKV